MLVKTATCFPSFYWIAVPGKYGHVIEIAITLNIRFGARILVA